jgi:hypothetical protein
MESGLPPIVEHNARSTGTDAWQLWIRRHDEYENESHPRGRTRHRRPRRVAAVVVRVVSSSSKSRFFPEQPLRPKDEQDDEH